MNRRAIACRPVGTLSADIQATLDSNCPQAAACYHHARRQCAPPKNRSPRASSVTIIPRTLSSPHRFVRCSSFGSCPLLQPSRQPTTWIAPAGMTATTAAVRRPHGAPSHARISRFTAQATASCSSAAVRGQALVSKPRATAASPRPSCWPTTALPTFRSPSLMAWAHTNPPCCCKTCRTGPSEIWN